MAVIAITGGPGAPGATTTALALLLSWPLPPGRKVLLVECDPDGGAALAGALEGRVEAVYGLRNLAVADRRGLLAQTLWDQLIDLSPAGGGDRLLLPGLTDPAQAAGLAYTWEPLVETLHALEPQGYDVLLDLGRSGAFGPSAVLARRADAVVATVRGTLRGLSASRPRLAALREDLESAGSGSDALGLLLITEGPYPAADVSRELGLPVLGQLPYAARTARVLSDGGDSTDRRFIRSELMRTARSAVDRIQELVQRRRLRLTPAPAAAQQAAPAPEAGGWLGGPATGRHPLAYPGGVPEAGYGWGAPEAAQVAQAVQAAQQVGREQQPYAPPSGQVYAPPVEQPPYVPPTAPTQTGPVQAGPIHPGPVHPGPVYPGPIQTGPVRPVAPQPQQPYPHPSLAGITPHPAAPEPFRAPQDAAQTQGEVLRAR